MVEFQQREHRIKQIGKFTAALLVFLQLCFFLLNKIEFLNKKNNSRGLGITYTNNCFQLYFLLLSDKFWFSGGGGWLVCRLPFALCWNFRTIYGGSELSRNRVVVPARQAT
jgi:hypothetical protein